MSNNVVSVYKGFSDHAENTLAVTGGFDSLINQYFNENDAKKFKTNLNIAIATAINTQGNAISECIETPLLRAKVCNSIMKIIQLGATIDYRYIYFTKFGGKNPDAGFNLQYQAEVKILEQKGYLDIQTGFVLKGEKFAVKTTMDGTEILHELDYQNTIRLLDAKDIITNVVCGYAIYTKNGSRTAFIVDRDILQTSYKMSTDRSTNSNKENLKWKFQKAINISIAHALFRHLVLKDWDSEEFEYKEKDVTPNAKTSSLDELINGSEPEQPATQDTTKEIENATVVETNNEQSDVEQAGLSF